MDDKKKIYTKTDFERYTEAVKSEFSSTILRQRERIEELKSALEAAEKKVGELEKQKALTYRAITAALKKADEIERVALIKYNQEIAQLKSFHNKWIGYFNRIIERYPLDDELKAAGKVNARVAEVLGGTPDLSAQYEREREKLLESLEEEDDGDAAATREIRDEYSADRSPAGFSFQEALHPTEDLRDIMRELGVILDE
ncbi:MAG: hypothetical protein J1F39_00380 [Clostridiales bacterium]|nr:hypothetical protein [Clostridiales bacterium]